MAKLQGIPTPSDSYDQNHSSLGTLTSLRALSASFDATIDSLTDAVRGHTQRLDSLTLRAERCRSKISRLRRRGKDEREGMNRTAVGTTKISCPDCYESVIKMDDMRHELRSTAAMTGRDDARGVPGDDHASALSRARVKSNAAVLSVLRREAAGVIGGGNADSRSDAGVAVADARPSDVWLDRASAFEERKTARLAVRLDAVPPLVVPPTNSVTIPAARQSVNTVSVEEEEARYYKLALGHVERDSLSSVCSTEGSPRHNSHQGSVTTDMSRDTIATNYSRLSHATASHRRRQRILAAASSRRPDASAGGAASAQAKDIKGDATSVSSIIYRGPPNISADNVNNTPLARQQAMTGSLPYLCELLHDTYGLGPPPNDFQGGNVFQEVKDLCDLTIYGTKRVAYGPQVLSSFLHDSNICTNIQKPDKERVPNMYSIAAENSDNHLKQPLVADGPMDTTPLGTKSNPTAYVPDTLAKDAGLFQLPENLPL